jgi:TolA-binding protein
VSAPKREPDFRGLGERIAREEDAILTRMEAAGPGPAFDPNRRVPKSAGAWVGTRAAIAAGALVAAAAGAVLFVRSRPLDLVVDGHAEAPGRWISAPAEAEVPIRFSDGTAFVLDPRASGRVSDVTRRGAHLMLDAGRARVSVTPNRGGQWQVTAGPFTVDVKGTKFDLTWTPAVQELNFVLTEGSVTISGCELGDARPIHRGERLFVSCLRHELRLESASAGTSSADAPVVDAPPATNDEPAPSAPSATAAPPSPPESLASVPAAPSARGAPAPDSWQSMARASRFADAMARVNDLGFDTELARAGRDDLVLLGDAARLTGDATHALTAYQRVRARAPGSDAAATAAFAIGRVYFDQRRAYADAARAFGTYLTERPRGPLAREAMGRRMEALSHAGDLSTAARVADEYLAKYPNGPHAPLARTLRTR